ncbi:MAG TPA: hypothetical protein VMS96_13045 [Terriglobales bacterium]|nr:hypothetical protein [Terriglobales bacterium]
MVFIAEDATALDRMLSRFMQHVRKKHLEDREGGGTPRWKPRRRRARAEESDQAEER